MAQDGSKDGDKAKDKGGNSTIAVTVNYQQQAETSDFRLSNTIEEVLDWAIDKFGIDPGMAGEFELGLHGVEGELPSADNLGRIAKGAKAVTLDLVRGEISNGASL